MSDHVASYNAGWERGHKTGQEAAAADIERLRVLSQNNAHSWDNIVRERDDLRADNERLKAEIEDWRGRLADQCGQTLAARYERDQARAALEPKP